MIPVDLVDVGLLALTAMTLVAFGAVWATLTASKWSAYGWDTLPLDAKRDIAAALAASIGCDLTARRDPKTGRFVAGSVPYVGMNVPMPKRALDR